MFIFQSPCVVIHWLESSVIPRLLHHLSTTVITRLGWEDWAEYGMELTWEPGAQDTTITTSGSSLISLDQCVSPKWTHKDGKTLTSG